MNPTMRFSVSHGVPGEEGTGQCYIVLVMVDHHVVVGTLPPSGLSNAFGLGMRPGMHVREIHPKEYGLAGFVLIFQKLRGASGDIVVNRFHPLFGQRAGVFDLLLAVWKRIAVNDSARAVLFPEAGEISLGEIIGQTRALQDIPSASNVGSSIDPVGARSLEFWKLTNASCVSGPSKPSTSPV